MANTNYHEMIKIKNVQKLRELQSALPSFCTLYFRGMSDKHGSRTAIGYAYDLQIFMNYICMYVFPEKNLSVKQLDLETLDALTKFDIENYLEYLSYYQGSDGITHANDAMGKARKLSAIKGLYNYLYEAGLLKNNPASIVHMPKIHEKSIIRLEANEVADLLDIVEFGSAEETKQQKNFHVVTKTRDLCLLTLLLGTGIRVSECVGLNLSDIDFDNNGLKIIRKGGNEAIVYFGDEVEDALREYMDQRIHMNPLQGHEEALFLSIQNRRITVRAVENLVKKYASRVTTLKKITPHKLRSTYGTQLYKESGDIYLVASVLGHKDVNTTKKHYADQDDMNRRKAAHMVSLRN